MKNLFIVNVLAVWIMHVIWIWPIYEKVGKDIVVQKDMAVQAAISLEKDQHGCGDIVSGNCSWMVINGSSHTDVCSMCSRKGILTWPHHWAVIVTAPGNHSLGEGCIGHYNNQGEDITRQKECPSDWHPGNDKVLNYLCTLFAVKGHCTGCLVIRALAVGTQ